MRNILKVSSINIIKKTYLVYIISILILFGLNVLILINLTNKNDFFYMIQINALIFSTMFCFSLIGVPLLFKGEIWKPKLYIKALIFFTLSLLFLPFYCTILIGIIHISNFSLVYLIEIAVYVYISFILIKTMVDSLKLIKAKYSDKTVETIIDIYSKLFNVLSLIMVLITAYLGMAGFGIGRNISLYTLLITIGLIVINIILYIFSYGSYARIFLKDLLNGFRN